MTDPFDSVARTEHGQEGRVDFLRKGVHHLTAGLSSEQTLERLCRHAVPASAECCWIETYSPYRTIYVEHVEPLAAEEVRRILERRAIRVDAPALFVEATGEALNAMIGDPHQVAMLLALAPVSLMLIPVRFDDALVGTMGWLTSGSGRRLAEADLPIANGLADCAAVALACGRLRRENLRALRNRGQLLSLLSHDLRNPLGVIAMQAMLLEAKRGSGELDDGELARALERIRRSIMQIEQLAEELLEGREARADTAVLDLTDEVAGRLERSLADAGVVLDVRIDAPGDGLLRCDRGQVVEALGQLVALAAERTSGGGRVHLHVCRQGAAVRFVVEHRGTASDPERLEALLHRGGRGGAGRSERIGAVAPSAREVAAAHGGAAWAEVDGLGVGRFVLELPHAE